MSFVISQRIGKKTLSGFYRKVETEGDHSRFLGAENGSQQVIKYTDTARVTQETTLARLYALDFDYLVGANQIQVYAKVSTLIASGPIPLGYVKIPQYSVEHGSALVDNGCTYEEVDSGTVRIKFISATAATYFSDFLFVIPHTASAAQAREKLTIRDQGDNVALEFEGDGDGALFKSPSGVKWLLRIDDSGNLVTENR